MRYKFVFLFLLCTFAVSCARSGGEREGVETVEIPIATFQKLESPLDSAKVGIKEIVLNDGGNKDWMQGEVTKVILNRGRLYVMDEVRKNLVVYDEEGNAMAKVGMQGRGPQEYVTLTDFTVTGDGGVVILDGNKDAILTFDNEYAFTGKADVKTDIDRIVALDGGDYLMYVSPWARGGSDYKVILTDSDQKEKAHFIENDGLDDPNFGFPYIGFYRSTSDEIFFLKPIDDNVYVFGDEGLVRKYNFDFGGRTVKDEYKKEIEKNFQDISGCSFLVNAVYVCDSYSVGMMMDRGNFMSFYADLTGKTLTDVTGLGYYMGTFDGTSLFFGMDERSGAPLIREVSF